MTFCRSIAFLMGMATIATLMACGGGGGATTYTVGGTVTGLTGSGLVLRDNGGDNLAVSATGAFTFATKVATGAPYSVTVYTQPTSPSQTCMVTNASGVLDGSNVTNVAVACTTNSYTVGGAVTGLGSGLSVVLQDNGGDNLTVNANGTFTFPGKLVPGAGYAVTVGTQPPGQRCLVAHGIGTVGSAAVTTIAVTCQLTDVWGWMGGANTGNSSGTYGTIGVPSATNVPGSRSQSASWRDPAGNFWLFGGQGDDSTGAYGDLNDLWSFNPATGEWIWASGSKTTYAPGSYGTMGVSAPSNVPGARSYSSSWSDSAGNLWLFGGFRYATNGTQEDFNDLWRFDPGIGQWTWVSGASTVNAQGVYGMQGVPASGNVPGARQASTAWIDSAGNLWLFGGYGYDSAATLGILNDVWKFSTATGLWTWVGGSNLASAKGSYGTLGIAAAGNIPGARTLGTGCSDAAGNVWLFGGDGYDSAGNEGLLNDLWKFNPSAGQWTWVSGASTAGANGIYGTLGVKAAGNVPGARSDSTTWCGGADNIWVFGGGGLASSGSTAQFLNDLWMFSATDGEWTWISGASTGNAKGSYGTLGMPAAGNVPGDRVFSASWSDSAGNLWLFGGFGNDSAYNTAYLNDMWKYQP